MTRSLKKRLEKLCDIQEDVSGSESEENFEEFQDVVNNNNDQELQGK